MLKALELYGFKSFADKTRFEFPPGITVVVGPNGSGKSNVVDAMKWVLGEQSAKSLRGDRMEDVIFAGSDGRKPNAAAEVRLMLVGVPVLPPPSPGTPGELTDEDGRPMVREVEVTRRLYRSGESEYLINGEGCRLRDVDGNTLIDFMCAYGPMIVGYRNPQVDEAAARQAHSGDLMTGPTERMVELAERLVALLPHADWTLFQKNGTDATTLCVTIARAATGRRKVIVARGAYHGAAPWCTPYPAGVTAEDRANLLHYEFNDLESLHRAAESVRGDVAAVIVSAFRHDLGRDQQLADPAFARGVRALCDETGAQLILDDVRAGFRLDLRGSWEPLGVRPPPERLYEELVAAFAQHGVVAEL